MINIEIIKVHAGQILPCGRVTGNKEFTIGGLIAKFISVACMFYNHNLIKTIVVKGNS